MRVSGAPLTRYRRNSEAACKFVELRKKSRPSDREIDLDFISVMRK